jgi:hypothetical protein
MKKLLIVGSLAISMLFGTIAHALTFDSNSEVTATNPNYWPFGDANNQRYQLWFSQSMMSGYTGTIDSITQFVYGASRTSSYNVDIYASTTNVNSASLSSTNLDSNSGSNRILIFSGTIDLNSQPTLTVDVNNIFTYDGSGNLLLDYVFNSFTGVGNYYDGPLMQAVDTNSDFYRITSNMNEGNVVYDWGAVRTAINFDSTQPVPEPSTLFLLGAGLAGLGFVRRRAKK